MDPGPVPILGYTTMSKYKKDPSRCVTPYCRNSREGQNRRCSKCRRREWRERYPLKSRLAHVRDRARRKGLEFALTLEDFAELERLCGGPITSRHHIDRICVARGYTRDNVQVLSAADNIAKGNRERGKQLQLL